MARRVAALVAQATEASDDADAASTGPNRGLLAAIKTEPGNVSLDSMLAEIDKLAAVRGTGLPTGLFVDVAAKVVTGRRERAAVEAPSHLRDHPDEQKLTLLAALLDARQREITDSLVALLNATVHRIGARADKKVTEQLLNEIKNVSGKENILFRLAEVATRRPDETLREVVYPAVGEQTPA